VAWWTKKLDLSSLREPTRLPWYQLSSEEKLEELKDRSDTEDRRLDQVERFHDAVKKVLWAIALALVGVLVKDIGEGWRLTSVPPAAQPSNNTPTIAPDFVAKPPPPKP
jgi:hypothetical protein